MAETKNIKFKHFLWIDINKPKHHDIEELSETYRFHPLDSQEALKKSHRSKIETRGSYTFIGLHFPVYDRIKQEIYEGEIKVFISKKFLITVHHGELDSFDEFIHLFEISKPLRDKFSDGSPERLLYEILNRIYLSRFPMIDHLIIDCDSIEHAIFARREERMISKILSLRRNITDFRKIMQVHKNVIRRMVHELKENHLFVMKKTDAYFESLIDYTKEMWDTLENLKERIEALQQTNESQISLKMSGIMKMLTIISVMTFPLTLIAAIFGMNMVHGMPFVNNANGFWIVILIMLGIITFMLSIFKWKKWF